jgi:NAD(P)-dependent dehydrogenase (short-subunit alcohol dehydrogenase family)
MVNVLLVGGATGFGIVLAKKLRAVGAKVFVVDSTRADLDDVNFIVGSVNNSSLIRRVVHECQVRNFHCQLLQSIRFTLPDFVIHIAKFSR